MFNPEKKPLSTTKSPEGGSLPDFEKEVNFMETLGNYLI
jgi:hypothetical protein